MPLKALLVALIIGVLCLTAGAQVFAKPQDKVAVCHKPGTPAEHTLYLPEPAVQAHLAHGDTLGECGQPYP